MQGPEQPGRDLPGHAGGNCQDQDHDPRYGSKGREGSMNFHFPRHGPGSHKCTPARERTDPTGWIGRHRIASRRSALQRSIRIDRCSSAIRMGAPHPTEIIHRVEAAGTWPRPKPRFARRPSPPPHAIQRRKRRQDPGADVQRGGAGDGLDKPNMQVARDRLNSPMKEAVGHRSVQQPCNHTSVKDVVVALEFRLCLEPRCTERPKGTSLSSTALDGCGS
jgi:hypothetical protein